MADPKFIDEYAERTDLFVGPVPHMPLPGQRTYKTAQIDWSSWDTPRIWDIVRLENNPNGWTQCVGFRQLANVLESYWRSLVMRRDEIRNAWQSPVGEAVAEKMTTFADSVLSESICATTTAVGLYGIMEALAKAKERMTPLHVEWNRVTSDWVPEWWDHEAARLNEEARLIAMSTENAVADYRKKITVPTYYGLGYEPRTIIPPPPPPPPPPGKDDDEGLVVPPVPGYQPFHRGREPTLEGLSPAELASIPQFVPAVPGQPVSMLPIPPGSPFAPYGGAYILPGPGVGRAGYVVPMPPPGGAPRSGVPPRLGPPSASAGQGMGMMPMPFAPPGAGGQGSSSSLYRRRDIQWQAAKGVPPMIEGVGDEVMVPDQPSEKQVEDFEEWFTDMAYPWRKDSGGDQPKITFRMVDK